MTPSCQMTVIASIPPPACHTQQLRASVQEPEQD